MSIVLRPHHLLCTQGYSGKGYDNDFVAHMTDVEHQLRDVPGTTIRLTFSTDTLCSCCPNKLGEDLCDTQEKVKRYDAKTVEYFGLEEKEYEKSLLFSDYLQHSLSGANLSAHLRFINKHFSKAIQIEYSCHGHDRKA